MNLENIKQPNSTTREKIRIIITGGTIDAEEIREGGEYIFKKTHIPQILEQVNYKTKKIEHEILFLKDSLDTTDKDRKKILEACKKCPENKIIITHGTDTMAETAQTLGKKEINKTIILTGAMIPFNQPNSDASFNIGFAIATTQFLPNGVYITMNGRVFDWNNVQKNKKLGLFEESKK